MKRIILVICFIVGWSSPSWAYLDPGTGSIILQGIAASIAAAAGVMTLGWYRVKMFFRRLVGRTPDEGKEVRK